MITASEVSKKPGAVQTLRQPRERQRDFGAL